MFRPLRDQSHLPAPERGAYRRSRRFWVRSCLLGLALSSVIAGGALAILNTFFPRKNGHDPSGTIQVFVQPFALVGVGYYLHRRRQRYAAAWTAGDDRPVEVRHVESGATLFACPNRTLQGADLAARELDGANFYGAPMPGANLEGANLHRAVLDSADLRGANLSRAFLKGAVLDYADLREAILTGADLTGASLADADLSGVVYDATTRWPPGFMPAKRGCRELCTPEVLPIPASAAPVDVTTLPIPHDATP